MAKTKRYDKLSHEEKMELINKANRRGNREAELEDKSGFISTHKIHKSKKTYSRKPKYKLNWDC